MTIHAAIGDMLDNLLQYQILSLSDKFEIYC